MAKEPSSKEKPKTEEANSHAGRIIGVRAKASEFEFDVEGKKGRNHTFVVAANATSLMSLVTAAFTSAKKLHVVVSTNGSGRPMATEVRFGNKPKVKAEKVKKAKPEIVKKPEAEAHAAEAAKS